MSETINNQSGPLTNNNVKISKTNRKNNKNQVVKWPNKDTYFTIKRLCEMNTDIVEISLRDKLNKARKEKIVEHIGSIHNDIGRPQLIFAMSPVSDSFLKSITDDSILLEPKYQTVNVLDISKKYVPSPNPASPYIRIQSNKVNAS